MMKHFYCFLYAFYTPYLTLISLTLGDEVTQMEWKMLFQTTLRASGFEFSFSFQAVSSRKEKLSSFWLQGIFAKEKLSFFFILLEVLLPLER